MGHSIAQMTTLNRASISADSLMGTRLVARLPVGTARHDVRDIEGQPAGARVGGPPGHLTPRWPGGPRPAVLPGPPTRQW